MVDEHTAEVSGNFSIEYCDSIFGGSKYCSVPFHFLSNKAHFVTFDGENKKAALKDDVIEFPAPAEKEGYVFEGWYLDGKRVDMSKPQLMPDHDINYVSKYNPIKFYGVWFYDAKMNLVGYELVQEGHAAKAPSAEDRDKNMGSSFKFVGWDRDFSCITENTRVYGIYMKVGQDNE